MLQQGRFRLDVRKRVFSVRVFFFQALEQAAKGGGGVTGPEHVQNLCRCSAWGSGIVVGWVEQG